MRATFRDEIYKWRIKMSHINYDFLSESFLFGAQLDDGFKDITDAEIKNEIHRYREYVISKLDSIITETTGKENLISITIESFAEKPNDNLLKQLALYVDQILISDPLFEMSEEKSESTKVMSEFYGIKNEEIDRKSLCEVMLYMKRHTPLIVCGYVKFIPMSFLHEAPREIPVMYEKDNYKNGLPHNIMDLLKENIDVRNTYKNSDGKLRVELEKPLQKGSGLYIYFPECSYKSGEIVQYQKSKLVEYDEKSRRAVFRLSVTDRMSDEEFSVWLNQSINKSCIHLYDETFQEFLFASRLNSMYLTQSELKARLIAMESGNTDSIQSRIANMTLKIDAPVFQNMDLSRIVDIRNNYGESFSVFRSELGEKLLHLSNVQDMNQLESELMEMTYQINDRYITDIKTEIKSLIRSIGLDVAIVTGALATNNIMSGNNMISVVTGILAAADGVKDSIKYFGNIKRRPGYFLWKLSDNKFLL